MIVCTKDNNQPASMITIYSLSNIN